MIKISFSKQNCNKGVAIVQILAGAVLSMIIIYGLISMLMYSARQQKNQTLLSNLSELQKRMHGMLNNPHAWRNTFKANLTTSFNCISLGNCVVGSQNLISEIRDASNNIFATGLPDSLLTPTYPSGGFTDRGIACSTFNGNAGAGNDNCPFTYKIIWEPIKTSASPAFRITAKLLYNPANSSTKTVIQLGAPTVTSPVDVRNIGKTPTTSSVAISSQQVSDSTAGKYDVTVWRTATSDLPTFRAVTLVQGNCNTGAAQPRQGWISSGAQGGYDPFDLVSFPASNKDIRFKIPGTYECDVSAAGYAVNGFTVILTQSNLPLPGGSSSGIAPAPNQQGFAQFNVSFQQSTADQDYQVQQKCDLAGSITTGYGLSGGVLASITCSLINPN